MIELTDETASDTMKDSALHECVINYCFTTGGKVVTRVLHFFVSEEKFKQQYQNTVADLATR